MGIPARSNIQLKCTTAYPYQSLFPHLGALANSLYEFKYKKTSQLRSLYIIYYSIHKGGKNICIPHALCPIPHALFY